MERYTVLVPKPRTMATTLSDTGSGIVTNGDIQPDGSFEVYFVGPKRISLRDEAVAEALIWRLMPLVRHAVQREMRGEKHEIEIIQ